MKRSGRSSCRRPPISLLAAGRPRVGSQAPPAYSGTLDGPKGADGDCLGGPFSVFKALFLPPGVQRVRDADAVKVQRVDVDSDKK